MIDNCSDMYLMNKLDVWCIKIKMRRRKKENVTMLMRSTGFSVGGAKFFREGSKVDSRPKAENCSN